MEQIIRVQNHTRLHKLKYVDFKVERSNLFSNSNLQKTKISDYIINAT